MKEWFRKLRYKLAHLIAPDWIDDLEDRLSGLLCEVTGGLLSKCYYPLNVMIGEAQNYQERECRECERYKECAEQQPRPLEEWGEDYGDVLWWTFPIEEPPYVGSPLDENWPGYHTHWTPIIVPQPPKED